MQESEEDRSKEEEEEGREAGPQGRSAAAQSCQITQHREGLVGNQD